MKRPARLVRLSDDLQKMPTTSPASSITLRQRLIIDHLLAADHELTAQDLADEVGASLRTIYRELPETETLLQRYGLTLEKKTGTGIRLLGTEGQRENLRREVLGRAVESVRPSDRRTWLACKLLAASEPIKIFALAIDLQVTITTVSHDLEDLEKWLATHELELVRKRGWGVALDGREADRRNAIGDLIFSQMEEGELRELFASAPATDQSARATDDFLLRPVWLLINRAAFRKAGAILRNLEGALPLTLSPAVWVEVALETALLISRSEEHSPCEPPSTPLDKSEYAAELAWAQRLAAALKKTLSEGEIARFALLVRAVQQDQTFSGTPRQAPESLPLFVKNFVTACEKLLDTALRNDPVFLEGLTAHLGRTLYRVEHRLPIRNPLLREIKNNYAELFATVQTAAGNTFTDPVMPEEEIGFLVLHVGSALERRLHRQFRALVVCSAGIGTSRILASRLRTEIPEIDTIDQLAWLESTDASRQTYDIVLSTVPLDLPPESYLLVRPLLRQEDIRQIRARLRRQTSAPLNRPETSTTRVEDDRIQRQMACARGLIKHWRIYPTPVAKKKTVAEVIPALLEPLRSEGFIEDPQRVITKIIARQTRGDLVIPGSKLAFLHAREPGVSRPSVTLHTLADSIRSTSGAVIDQCVLMLAPENLHRVEIAVLSQVSSLLMRKEAIDLLASNDEEKSRAWFTAQLNAFLREQLTLE